MGNQMTVEVKEQIAEAMIKLSRKKDAGKITVKDLVSECGVSRQIFYYYYEDIYDVLKYILERDVSGYAAESIKIDDPFEAVKHFITCIIDNADEVRKGLESKLRPEVEAYLLQTLKKYVRYLIEHRLANVALKQQDINFLTDFAACGITGRIIENTMKDEKDVDEYCHQLLSLMQARIDQLA